jgi:predicted nucleotidyltransferase
LRLQKAIFPQDNVDLGEVHRGLEKVFQVSTYLNFPLTLDEIATYFLPKSRISGEELRSLIVGGHFADIPFQLRGGYLFASTIQSETARLEREQMSAAKLLSAAEFAVILTRLVPFIRTVAVTGSVAYGSASKWDDIDLFIVTKQNRLWLSAFMALVLVRIRKLLALRPPYLSPFCLSYVHDEQGFARESQKNRTNALFARELLKARPVAGVNHYRKILEENGWVANFYSKPYATRLRQLENGISSLETGSRNDPIAFSASFFVDWAEALAFAFLSRYLQLRAYLTNLKLKSRGLEFRVFQPRLSAASCVYTSNFYRWLQGLWGQ